LRGKITGREAAGEGGAKVEDKGRWTKKMGDGGFVVDEQAKDSGRTSAAHGGFGVGTPRTGAERALDEQSFRFGGCGIYSLLWSMGYGES
jgi:hypothetical protein